LRRLRLRPTSRRTRDALKAARKRIALNGQRQHRRVKRLGNPYGAEALRRADRGNTAAVAKARFHADQRARDLAPVVAGIRAKGALTLDAIANELNEREMVTARGDRWYASSVANLLRRLEGVA
jgi:hypothetical protein